MTPIEAGEEILRCIDYINKARVENNEMQSELDKQLRDLLHLLEFTPIDIQRGYRLAKQIQDVCRRRRMVKDEHEQLRILHENAIATPTGTKFTVDLTRQLGNTKKRVTQLENRVYTPRSQAFREQAEGG